MCGASVATPEEAGAAEAVGRLLAQRGCAVVCGGLGGVMAAVARGVRDAGGTCIGLLPGDDHAAGDPSLTIALPTGMGEMRNALLARVSAAMIAIGGGYGTLSEIGLGLRLGRPVAALRTWHVQPEHGGPPSDDDMHVASSPKDAVTWVLRRIAVAV